MEDYDHLVEIDAETRRLVIYRVFRTGSRVLFTSVDLPSRTRDEDPKAYETFATLLGENLIIDSPIARKLLGL